MRTLDADDDPSPLLPGTRGDRIHPVRDSPLSQVDYHLLTLTRQQQLITLGTASGLLVGQARRHGRQRSVLGNRQVLAMSPERAFVVSEDPLADLQRVDGTADRIDSPANSLPKAPARGLAG